MEGIEIFAHQVSLLDRVISVRPIRVLIGDEIGLGKTIEAISILRYLEKRGELRKCLIIVPRVLLNQWKEELKRLGVSPREILVISSGNELEEIESRREKYVVISIGLVRMDRHLSRLLNVNWDSIVVDEAHNVTLRSKKTKKAIEELTSNDSRNVLFLSATPHRGATKDYLFRLKLLDTKLNGLDKLDCSEFYSLTHNSIVHRRTKEVVNLIENSKIFTDCHFFACLVKPTNIEKEFHRKLINFLRRKVREAREKGEELPVELMAVLLRKRASSSPNAAIKTFSRILRNLDERISETSSIRFTEDIEEKINVVFGEEYSVDTDKEFDELIKGFCDKFSGIIKPEERREVEDLLKLAKEIKKDDSKLKATLELVKDKIMSENKKVVIFTEYIDTLDYIKKRFEKDKEFKEEVGILTLSSRNRRDFSDIVLQFSRDPSYKLLLATDVASEGLNLQTANVIVNYEPPWTPIKIEQRIGRAWRLGQRSDVQVYTFFLAVEGDQDVLEKLYKKVMSMHEALGDVRPITGDKVINYYRAKATASDSLWRSSEVQEVEINKRKRRVTEYNLIAADLREELDEFVNAILETLCRINSEITRKRIYPESRKEEIFEHLKSILGTSSVSDYKNELEKITKEMAKRGIIKTERVNNLRKAIEFMQVISSDKGTVPSLILSSGGIEGIKYLVRVSYQNNRDYFLLYDPVRKDFKIGVNLLEYLREVIRGGMSVPSGGNIKPKLTYADRAKIRRKIDEIRGYQVKPFERYLKESKDFRDEAFPESKEDVSMEVICVFVNTSEDLLSRPDPSLRNEIEKAAMEVAKKYEVENGRKPEDVSDTESYDLYSSSSGGEERFIEVKGHLGFRLYAELTENEYNIAKEKREKYYLYLVINLEENEFGGIDKEKAVLLEFRDPIESMNVEVFGEKRYLFTPKGYFPRVEY